MKIKLSELRQIIREEQEDMLDQVMDQADDAIETLIDQGDDILSDIASELENVDETVDEAAGVIAAGLASAMPIVLKGLGKLARLAGKALSKLPGADAYDYETMGDEWKAWWYGKSEELHHMYVGFIEKIVSLLYKIATRGKGKLDPAKKHKLAEGLWTVVVAYLMVASGMGVIKAYGAHSYGVASLESALTAVKAEEVGAFLIQLIIRTVGDTEVDV